jgi:enoyl-[acyl-carrier protein] reductase III
MHDLKGKVALVTGGTRGLGRAISRSFAMLGATVAMNYRRDEDSATAALAEVRAIAPQSILIRADLESEAEVRTMVARAASKLGHIDILVANAAATAFKRLCWKPSHTSPAYLQPERRRVRRGRAGSVAPHAGRRARAHGLGNRFDSESAGAWRARCCQGRAGKHGGDFAFELGPRGITVNGLNVGYIDTDSARFYTRYLGISWEEFKGRCEQRSALKRLPSLEEIASVACLICLPEASYLTAQTILVDGGFTLHFPGAE